MYRGPYILTHFSMTYDQLQFADVMMYSGRVFTIKLKKVHAGLFNGSHSVTVQKLLTSSRVGLELCSSLKFGFLLEIYPSHLLVGPVSLIMAF